MRAPDRTAKIADRICQLQPDGHRRVDMLAIVKREIDGLVELSECFAPLLRANQVAREAEDLIKTTTKLQRAYRKLAQNPLLAGRCCTGRRSGRLPRPSRS